MCHTSKCHPYSDFQYQFKEPKSFPAGDTESLQLKTSVFANQTINIPNQWFSQSELGETQYCRL